MPRTPLATIRASAPPVRPRGWAHRNWLVLTVAAVVLAGGVVAATRPWERCGPGLTDTGGGICAGLNLASGPFRADDPLADLEDLIARRNSQAAPDAKTIVVLENMTADASIDSTPIAFVRHEIEGAITAAWPAPESTGIRLLLAGFGGNAVHWREVVDQVVAHAESERIVAVTGIGVSLDTTREAVAALSQDGIVTIGGTVTSDDLNVGPDNKPVKNFFRVGPTNSDEAHAAVNYLKGQPKQRTMLVMDSGESDAFAATLAKAFLDQRTVPVESTKKFSLPDKLTGASRDEYLHKLFGGWHAEICANQPDVVYFAGRGVDLRSFVEALADSGACARLPNVTVLAGDDTATVVGKPLPLTEDIAVKVLYTGLAYPGQWAMFTGDPASSAYQRNYNRFFTRFTTTHRFPAGDLADGGAMIQHDAVAAAVEAAGKDPAAGSATIANFLTSINCSAPVPGASGPIAFRQEDHNQVGKALPILLVRADGTIEPVNLVWSQGHPLDTSPTCVS